jgi:phosphoglycolate phosphatase
MLVVGLDLDLTLLDSRAGIRNAMLALSAATSVAIDADLVVRRLGPKLETELAHWFPAADIPAAAGQFRELYWDSCVSGTAPMVGARETVAAIHARGGHAIAVTGKTEPLAHRCLEAVGLELDGVVGDVYGDEKAAALRAHNADAYIGDTIADVRAAVSARVTAIGVATGMHDRDELHAAGADVVFDSLVEFPPWLER